MRAFRGVGGEPFFVNKAKGCTITDVDGREVVKYWVFREDAGSREGVGSVSDGPLQAHCVAASFYDGDAALGIDASEDPGQSVGKVCDLFGVAPRGATVLLLEPAEEKKGNGELARSTVTFIRPQRWSELDYALED